MASLLFLCAAVAYAAGLCGDLYVDDRMYYFPLSKLAAPKGFTTRAHFTGMDFNFTVGICSPVPCPWSHPSAGNRLSNVAACQAWMGKDSRLERSLGDLQTATYVIGDTKGREGFTVTYTQGDSCASSPRSVTINVICSKMDKEPRLQFDGEGSQCGFRMSLYAAEGPCLVPVQTNELVPKVCHETLKSTNGRYAYHPDRLARLRVHPYNDSSFLVTDKTYDYEVNICEAVDCPGHPTGSVAACQRWSDPDKSVHTRSIGSLARMTIEENGKDERGFRVVYSDGDACSTKGYTRGSIIHVVCDDDAAPGEGQLKFLGESSHCLSEFELKAAEACPEVIVAPPPPPIGRCPATIDLSDELEYRTSALAAPLTISAEMGGDHPLCNYTLALCGKLDCDNGGTLAGVPKDPVAGHAAVCQSCLEPGGAVRSRALAYEGHAAVSLVPPEDDGFVVTYTNGDVCDEANPSTVRVQAECDPDRADAVATLDVEATGCTFEFTIRSAAACPQLINPLPEPMPCVARLATRDGRRYYPVSKLTAIVNAYRATTDISEFQVNICGPVECVGAEIPAGVVVSGCHWTQADSGHVVRAIGRVMNSTLTPHDDDMGFTVTAAGGDVCGGDVRHGFVTRVRCSSEDVVPRLVYEGVTALCLHEFTLYAAEGPCPVDAVDGKTSFDGGPPGLLGVTQERIKGIIAVAVVMVVVFTGVIVAFCVREHRLKSRSPSFTTLPDIDVMSIQIDRRSSSSDEDLAGPAQQPLALPRALPLPWAAAPAGAASAAPPSPRDECPSPRAAQPPTPTVPVVKLQPPPRKATPVANARLAAMRAKADAAAAAAAKVTTPVANEKQATPAEAPKQLVILADKPLFGSVDSDDSDLLVRSPRKPDPPSIATDCTAPVEAAKEANASPPLDEAKAGPPLEKDDGVGSGVYTAVG